jgi:hypothetical protein
LGAYPYVPARFQYDYIHVNDYFPYDYVLFLT